jgi:hypothetical protein
LEQAAKKLPESYLIESILSLTASNAKQAGINLTGFKPSCELKGQADFKYVEREIDVTASGKFQQLASFFDKMVHTDVMLFLRAISIEPFSAVEENENRTGEKSPYQIAQLARQNLSLNASFKVVVFRAMKDEESDYFERKENCATEEEEMLLPPAAVNAPVANGAPPAGDAPPPPDGG